MNELLEIVKLLGREYTSGENKWQVIKAEKIGHCEDEPDGWELIIKKVRTETEEAANESN